MRLFVGLPLPLEIRQSLAMLASGLPGAKWVNLKNLHLTLCFIGNVDNAKAEDIDCELSAIFLPAFSLTLDGVGHFGSDRAVRSLWAGIAPSQPLASLHEKVVSALIRSGQPPEKQKFVPHVTLARFKNGAAHAVGRFIAANNCFTAEPFEVTSFALFQSHLGRAGPDYMVKAEYQLFFKAGNL